MPFAEYRKGCPHCGCQHFKRNMYGFPLFRYTISRFWCPKCKGKFFRAKRERNMSDVSEHVSKQHYWKH